MEKQERQGISAEITRSVEELLRWAQDHPHCTLEELEERVQQWKARAATQLLEAAVKQQGTGALSEETCSCGGRWVFQGYRERAVMTSQGLIRVRRAYFTCERCGAGIFPPGLGEEDSGRLE
jgi:hypothetical protein